MDWGSVVAGCTGDIDGLPTLLLACEIRWPILFMRSDCFSFHYIIIVTQFVRIQLSLHHSCHVKQNRTSVDAFVVQLLSTPSHILVALTDCSCKFIMYTSYKWWSVTYHSQCCSLSYTSALFAINSFILRLAMNNWYCSFPLQCTYIQWLMNECLWRAQSPICTAAK